MSLKRRSSIVFTFVEDYKFSTEVLQCPFWEINFDPQQVIKTREKKWYIIPDEDPDNIDPAAEALEWKRCIYRYFGRYMYKYYYTFKIKCGDVLPLLTNHLSHWIKDDKFMLPDVTYLFRWTEYRCDQCYRTDRMIRKKYSIEEKVESLLSSLTYAIESNITLSHCQDELLSFYEYYLHQMYQFYKFKFKNAYDMIVQKFMVVFYDPNACPPKNEILIGSSISSSSAPPLPRRSSLNSPLRKSLPLSSSPRTSLNGISPSSGVPPPSPLLISVASPPSSTTSSPISAPLAFIPILERKSSLKAIPTSARTRSNLEYLFQWIDYHCEQFWQAERSILQKSSQKDKDSNSVSSNSSGSIVSPNHGSTLTPELSRKSSLTSSPSRSLSSRSRSSMSISISVTSPTGDLQTPEWKSEEEDDSPTSSRSTSSQPTRPFSPPFASPFSPPLTPTSPSLKDRERRYSQRKEKEKDQKEHSSEISSSPGSESQKGKRKDRKHKCRNSMEFFMNDKIPLVKVEEE